MQRWRLLKGRADPIQLLIDLDAGRVPKLIPIRYGRMLQSPFAFLRGSAVVMAEDLFNTPCSDIYVQCCGDLPSDEFRRLCDAGKEPGI